MFCVIYINVWYNAMDQHTLHVPLNNRIIKYSCMSMHTSEDPTAQHIQHEHSRVEIQLHRRWFGHRQVHISAQQMSQCTHMKIQLPGAFNMHIQSGDSITPPLIWMSTSPRSAKYATRTSRCHGHKMDGRNSACNIFALRRHLMNRRMTLSGKLCFHVETVHMHSTRLFRG